MDTIKMEYFNLNEATVTVTTQLLLDMETDRCFGMTLSDYGDMDEFRCGCSELFPAEVTPQYRYVSWENIPGSLITREWLCPNFFDIREALAQLDEEEMAFFHRWCDRYRYDLRTDNPWQLVADYRNMFGEYREPVHALPECDEEGISCGCSYMMEEWVGVGLLRQEFFNDDYD